MRRFESGHVNRDEGAQETLGHKRPQIATEAGLWLNGRVAVVDVSHKEISYQLIV